MQVLYSEHVHTYFLLGVIHVSTVANVKLISRTNTTKEFGDYTLHMFTCITVCLHQHHAHRGFTDSPAGTEKRSPSIIVLHIEITVSLIHQISDYIKMYTPGVKQYTLSLWQLYTVSSRSLITFVCQKHNIILRSKSHLYVKNTFVCQKHILRSKSHLYVKNMFVCQKHICMLKTHGYVKRTFTVHIIMPNTYA